MSGRASLEGTVAIVTGGGSGIGLAIGRRLHAEGASVALVDLHEGVVARAAETIPGAIGLGADVTDEQAVLSVVERVETTFGPVDIYCSNAGIGGGPGLGSDEDWARLWAVHGMAHIYAARAVTPSMAARGGGDFVITASAAGLLMLMGSAPYTVTKHASVAIAEWMAVAFGDAGINVHCLAPQGVRTPLVSVDARAESEVRASGTLLEPEAVADEVLAALRSGAFLILPHPEVRTFEAAKVADRDRWLANMRKLRARL